jgi:hypothetical protein
MSNEQKEAFEEGRNHALKGYDWTQCRYSVRSPLFTAWKQGFESVRKWK